MQLDDDTYFDISPSHSIGEIKLVIFRTTTHEVLPKERHEHPNYHALPHLEKVHERSKKAIAHRVKFVVISHLV
jgi:hypothetical protein